MPSGIGESARVPPATRLQPQRCPIKYVKYYSSDERAALQSIRELDWKICGSVSSSEGLCGFVRYELVPVRILLGFELGLVP